MFLKMCPPLKRITACACGLHYLEAYCKGEAEEVLRDIAVSQM